MRESLIGAELIDSRFFKKEREAFLVFKGDKGTLALGLAYHPISYGAFLIPASKIAIDTPEKPWPFFQPTLGGTVTEIRQYGLDRIFRINIDKKNESFSIVIEAIGLNGNIWLLDKNDLILATLRNRKYDPAVPFAPLTPSDRINPFEVTAKEIEGIMAEAELPPHLLLKKKLAGLDEILAREIIHRAGGETNHDPAEVQKGTKSLAESFGNFAPAYYYDNIPYAAPLKLKSLAGEPVKLKTLSLALYEAVKSGKTAREETSQKDKILEAVRKHLKRHEKKLGNIEKDLEQSDLADQFRRYGEILMAHLHDIRKGMNEIELPDLHAAAEGKVKIKLDPAQNAATNAEQYFKKARKARESRELLERRLEIGRAEKESSASMLAELENDFESASEKYQAEIAAILPAETTQRAQAPRLPYREYTLSTGLRIFVGKDGSDNDETTFHHAKPYELWFHASQCPGSHVVIKFPNKDFVPSKNEIAETAAIAAYHSKARKSKAVPVIYTERRFVRKPRGAKPGLVTVEREKMVMVEPKKPE